MPQEMRPFSFATVSAAAGSCSDDRAEVFEHEDTLIVVVADGAGGLAGGARASDAVVDAVRSRIAARPFDPYNLRAWSEELTTADAELARRMEAGETTAVIVVVGPYGVVGASVGDSEAWVVGRRTHRLTEKQERARLGTGRCRPTTFHRRHVDGVLVVATDGLFRHARSEAIANGCAAADATTAARTLVGLPKLRSGTYPDDVAVVVVIPKATPP